MNRKTWTNKDKKKIIRSILEAIVLLMIAMVIIRALVVFKTYEPYQSKENQTPMGEDAGFIAISYIAVDRTGTSTMISTKRLEEHFKALYDNGYVTITQKDIENYYKKGTPLPQKSLFLMFEDGRRDTAIFAQKIMEKYNYLGTILSYANKFEKKDTKFLSPKDLLSLKESTFWELGTNGYRLSYINVFDRYDNYLGELNSVEYSVLRRYLGRDYNQYLMDFIRDEHGIPKETYNQMKDRISTDYKLMDEIYTNELGEVPEVYVLMHANTGSYANNEKVSEMNHQWMTRLFTMNFNREGYSYNNNDSDLYDLTRMQPQSYWYPNHLLMRIADDTGEELQFIIGDAKKKEQWDTLSGVAEYRESKIILTSISEGNGMLRLKDSKNYKNINLSVSLEGNKLGTQAIYLRGNDTLTEYVSVKIQNNHLIIDEDELELYSLDLNEFDGIDFPTIVEDKQNVLEAEYELYKNSESLFTEPTRMEEQTGGIVDGELETESEEKYIPTIQINEPGNRTLDITLVDNSITIFIDGKEAITDLKLSSSTAGYIYLESAWGEYGYSQRNIADDVYDGVFTDLLITEDEEDNEDEDDNEVLYDDRLHGLDKIKLNINNSWNELINWFINNL
jgi:hypothetical protein